MNATGGTGFQATDAQVTMTLPRAMIRPFASAAARAAAALLIPLIIGPASLSARQVAGSPEEDTGSAPDPRWAFFFNLGAGGVGGDFSSALEQPATGEFGLRRAVGDWRYGLGVSFGSFAMKPPHEDEPEWGYQRIFLSGTRAFRTEERFRPYVQGRVGLARVHPRSELFAMDPLPPDFAVGDSPTKPSNGFHVAVVPGLEWQLSRFVGLDASFLAGYHGVGEMDLSPVGQGPASSGLDWQARLGLFWWADSGRAGVEPQRDVWGVRRSWAWGLGEALAINFAASAINEYVRNANFNQISPRSWWSNLQDGFTYDDNDFVTNQFIHPFNGSQYYNSGRANGLGFWSSYGVALIGATHWELAGETHPMSFNDLVSTGIGGAAVGETQYRLSSMMLDSEATGARRFFREAGGFLVAPIRGFNRIVSGRAWEVRPNPTDRADTNPVGQINDLSFGWRRVGDGESLQDDVTDLGFLEFYHVHGNPFEAERRGPFDFFTFEGLLNFGDDRKIGRLMIQGNLLTESIGDARPSNHVFALVQHFQYMNGKAYEYGGQSLGAAVLSRWGSLGSVGLQSRFDLLGTILGAVNSEAAGLADVADPERLREYDYGPGGGANASIWVTWKGFPVLNVLYRLHYVRTVNGSIYHQDDLIGLDSHHWLHGVDARIDVPIASSWGIGARYSTFARRSHYDLELPQELPPEARLSVLVDQNSPELRLYLSYIPSIR
jgi:hypothetical protein